MTTLTKLTIATAALTLATAGVATAGDMSKASETKMTQTETRVLGAVETRDMVRVVDAEGNVYYNRVIAFDDLPDPELELDTLDTYVTQYEGRTYTNKVVIEEK